VRALIVKGFNFMHNRHTIGKKVQIFFKDKLNCTKWLVSWANLRIDLFGVSFFFLCSTSSIFSAVLFVGRPLPFLRRTLPVSCFQNSYFHMSARSDHLSGMRPKFEARGVSQVLQNRPNT
jgi:hypothetical protein